MRTANQNVRASVHDLKLRGWVIQQIACPVLEQDRCKLFLCNKKSDYIPRPAGGQIFCMFLFDSGKYKFITVKIDPTHWYVVHV